MDIEDLPLPRRVKNRLRGERIKTVQDLTRLSEVDLLKLPDIGKKGIRDIKDALSAMGLSLRYPHFRRSEPSPQKTVYVSHLTLRGWYAGQALMGLIASNRPLDEVVERSWQLADEMIESSSEPKEPST